MNVNDYVLDSFTLYDVFLFLFGRQYRFLASPLLLFDSRRPNKPSGPKWEIDYDSKEQRERIETIEERFGSSKAPLEPFG